ncbi:hypothetical protein Kfla_2308 [Kribbella flavida DSM 17836]|uniref:Winged helix DNA-binding domain-containing protein n=1 Tax=Kribbella flavida (strain DSM 17836 / JCM 10339 / NBRC 14399) TaxID=479435 RepID=D2PTS1_KRIFD|nr:winged helix DNA-binding domain-containing protein [Kribbella flavida]ADB31384.1 hypothetical protein Kfla_2308 [Kribbella flavida DSM 17836]
METPELRREQVLGHRAVVQALAEPARRTQDTPLLGLGLQNTPPGSGAIGLAARTQQSSDTVTALFEPGGPVAVVMAARGAPYVVRRTDLPLLAAALYPLDAQEGAEVDEVAAAMREVVRGDAVSRPDLSEELNGRVSDGVRAWCERCQSVHVRERLFRKATLQAGFELDAQATPTVFRSAGAQPSADRDTARAELFRRYVHLVGVTSPAEVATWLDYKAGAVKEAWSLLAEELTACRIEGKRRWALTADLESLLDGRLPSTAKLLPPSDAYLLGERSLVVPDREYQRELWRAVANPGALLLDGEIVGTWRHRLTDNRLQVTFSPFRPLSAAARNAFDQAAESLAALRSTAEVTTTWP